MKVDQFQATFFSQLLFMLEEAGVRREQLLDELLQQDVTISGADQGGFSGTDAPVLLETAVKLSGDPCLMLRLGQQLGIECFGSFGFALMSCASLRESVELLLRYGQVLFRPTWTAHEYEGGILLRVNIATDVPARQQLVAELSFSNLVALGRTLYGSQVENAKGVELQLSYPRPAHLACYNSVFNRPVQFDSEHSQLFLPSQVLDTPVKTANRSEHVVFHQQCEEMLHGLTSAEKTTAAVRQVLIQSAGDFLDIAQVAESLYVSERTLRRRLEGESTSFRSIFEEIRNLLAREYLAATELTVADIAHLLDYSETVNFRRAFLRWNTITPSEYRQQQG
jgi:AraC-like DNA-binding protein